MYTFFLFSLLLDNLYEAIFQWRHILGTLLMTKVFSTPSSQSADRRFILVRAVLALVVG